MKSLYVLCVALLLLCACVEDPEKAHLGAWEAETNEGPVVWVFSETGLEIQFETGAMTVPYKIDYSQKPIWLDLEMGDKNTRCIVEFTARNTFRVIGEEKGAGARPSDFDNAEKVMTFTKK